MTIGLSCEENKLLKRMLVEMGADFVKVLACTENMLHLPLEEALQTEENLDAQGLNNDISKRAIFLSGMSGGEVQDVIASFHESGLRNAVFAALVPNNAQRLVAGLVEEIYEDDQLMVSPHDFTRDSLSLRMPFHSLVSTY